MQLAAGNRGEKEPLGIRPLAFMALTYSCALSSRCAADALPTATTRWPTAWYVVSIRRIHEQRRAIARIAGMAPPGVDARIRLNRQAGLPPLLPHVGCYH